MYITNSTSNSLYNAHKRGLKLILLQRLRSEYQSMAKCGMSITAIAVSFLILLHLPSLCTASIREAAHFIPPSDVDLLEFPLNLEYLEAEFFLFSSLGHGLDKVAPELAMGGPSPVGAQKANLSPFIKDIITQFAYQEVGHVRYFSSCLLSGYGACCLF